jgi:hypothetical protein
VMQVAVVEIIDVAVVADRRMPAVGTMLMGMVGMMFLGAGSHDALSFFLPLPSSAVRAPGTARTGLGVNYKFDPADLWTND